MVYFKILLIILAAFPVILISGLLFSVYSSYARDMNRRDAARERALRAGSGAVRRTPSREYDPDPDDSGEKAYGRRR